MARHVLLSKVGLVYFSPLPAWQNAQGIILLRVYFCYKILLCMHRAWCSGYNSRKK